MQHQFQGGGIFGVHDDSVTGNMQLLGSTTFLGIEGSLVLHFRHVSFVKKVRLFFDSFLIIAIMFSQTSFVVAQMLPADSTTPAADTAPSTEMTPDTEMPGPSISRVSVTDITDTSARVDVDSDEMVQGYVEYGTTEQYGMSTPLTSEFTTNPEFLLENLTPETLYHYRVIVMDSSGGAAITTDETFTTLPPPPEATEGQGATPEEPSPPTDNDTSTSMGSTGSTTQTASSSPQVATTTQPTSSTGSTTLTASSSPQAATSTPPTPALAVSNTKTAAVSTTTVRITWQTNKSADSQVQYGATNAYGSLSSVGPSDTSHTVNLSGLTPNTKYYYRAVSKTASGETAYSSSQQFTTLAVQTPPSPPVISNVSTSVSTSSVTITWTTSKPATSDIQYGTTTSYGFTLGKDAALKTLHVRRISNLPARSLYHFRPVVADSGGNTAFGKDRTFTTSAAPSAPVSTTPLVATSTPNTDTLEKIADRGTQAAASVPRGGGGIPVAPTRPLLLKVTALDGQVAFDWRKDRGVKNSTIRTLIVRKEGTDPVRSRIDGGIIYDGPSTAFTDTNVENGKEYHYALYSYGGYGRFTTATRFKVIPRADKEQVDLSAEEEEEFIPLDLSRNLFQGRQGDDITLLQTHLSDNGYYPEALITGYFGPLTRKAVIRYQILNGIVPAVGYVGPLTRGALAQ